MSIDRERLRWNGWGRLGESFGLTPARERALLERLGARLGRPLASAPPPVPLAEVRLPPPKLPTAILDALAAACGEDGVRTDAAARATHAAGKSLPDLLRLRRGEIQHPPEAVVLPPDEGAVGAVLRIAAEAGLAVVPFGGGTSVVGGVEARAREGQAGVISLDTTRLDRLVRLDEPSATATFQAGIDGPALEAALGERGWTLGHFPQSFEQSTLGGWIATRSSGQLSNRYGGIERMVVSVRGVTPEGVVRTLPVPRSAAGPDLNELMLGSEGALGVIVEATVRIRRLPRVREFRGALLRDFASGAEVIREAVQEGLPLSMLRLSDAAETELGIEMRHDPARRHDPASWVLRGLERLGWREGRALLLYGAEGGHGGEARTALRRMRALVRRHGGAPLGRGPGRSWQRDRFRTPFLRDWLLDHGVAVDTVETALPWSRVLDGHGAIIAALEASLARHAGGGIAMAHLSHSYRDGACLYFTVLYPLDAARDVEQWAAIKHDATEAILDAGGTLSHHHGVGMDHAPWLVREKGLLGVEVLRAAKARLDPAGIMNPGKLL